MFSSRDGFLAYTVYYHRETIKSIQFTVMKKENECILSRLSVGGLINLRAMKKEIIPIKRYCV